jgi:hypothetical protein
MLITQVTQAETHPQAVADATGAKPRDWRAPDPGPDGEVPA